MPEPPKYRMRNRITGQVDRVSRRVRDERFAMSDNFELVR